jgi:hypothetical protein
LIDRNLTPLIKYFKNKLKKKCVYVSEIIKENFSWISKKQLTINPEIEKIN